MPTYMGDEITMFIPYHIVGGNILSYTTSNNQDGTTNLGNSFLYIIWLFLNGSIDLDIDGEEAGGTNYSYIGLYRISWSFAGHTFSTTQNNNQVDDTDRSNELLVSNIKGITVEFISAFPISTSDTDNTTNVISVWQKLQENNGIRPPAKFSAFYEIKDITLQRDLPLSFTVSSDETTVNITGVTSDITFTLVNDMKGGPDTTKPKVTINGFFINNPAYVTTTSICSEDDKVTKLLNPNFENLENNVIYNTYMVNYFGYSSVTDNRRLFTKGDLILSQLNPTYATSYNVLTTDVSGIFGANITTAIDMIGEGHVPSGMKVFMDSNAIPNSYLLDYDLGQLNFARNIQDIQAVQSMTKRSYQMQGEITGLVGGLAGKGAGAIFNKFLNSNISTTSPLKMAGQAGNLGAAYADLENNDL